MKKYNIILADDHSMFLQGMEKLINSKKDMMVIGTANDGAELMELLKELTPDMILLDISMPNLKGIEALKIIKEQYSEIKIIMLTMHKSRAYMNTAISAGADGFLLKENSDIELFSAINKVRGGESFINVDLAMELSQEQPAVKSPDNVPLSSFSEREIEIIKYIAKGLSNKDVATELNLSPRTIENHRSKIMKKMKTNKIADLIRYAFLKGILVVT
ncbi:MAG: response regulator transcription factor [Desulfobacterales bacterium]|nr:response regulator transcription factor [Desulfobacterales bacterium]